MKLSWGRRRPQPEAESTRRSSRRGKWMGMLFRQSRRSKEGKRSSSKIGSSELKNAVGKEPRQKERQGLTEAQQREQLPHSDLMDVPPSPASSTGSSSLGEGVHETPTRNVVSSKASAPSMPEIRHQDFRPKTSAESIPQIATVAALAPKILHKPELAANQNQKRRPSTILPDWWKKDKETSKASMGAPSPAMNTRDSASNARSIPQIATVAALAPEILSKPKVADDQKRRSSTDLPDWWKEDKESLPRRSSAIKRPQEQSLPKGDSARGRVPGTSLQSRISSEPSAKELIPSMPATLVGPSAISETKSRGEKAPTQEPRRVPAIATIADLAPKILKDPKLCTKKTNPKRQSSTALPDWWKQRLDKQQEHDKLGHATWHGRSMDNASLKQSRSLHEKEDFVSRHIECARRVSFSSEPAALESQPSHEPTSSKESSTRSILKKIASKHVESQDESTETEMGSSSSSSFAKEENSVTSSFSDDASKSERTKGLAGSVIKSDKGSDRQDMVKVHKAELNLRPPKKVDGLGNLLPLLLGGLFAAYALAGFVNQLQFLQLIFF